MTAAETDIIALWAGLGGLVLLLAASLVMALVPGNARRHPDGSAGLFRDGLLVTFPGLVAMCVFLARGSTDIEHSPIWPLPLVGVVVLVLIWTATPAIRRAGARLAAVHGRSTR